MYLNRQLEPEVMDTTAAALEYDAMDHANVNRLFVSDLLAANPFPDLDPEEDNPPLVLDIGTGTAQIPIELCQQDHFVRVRGVDLAVAMLDQARMNIEVEGLIERISLAQVDAKKMPFPDASFDCVMSNSIVHHIPSPETVLAEAVRVAKPGSLVFIRDLLRPATEADVTHLVATYAADATDHQRQMLDDSLRAALTLDEIRAVLDPLGVPTECVTATSDRHWTLCWKKSN